MLLDVGEIFEARKQPVVIASGELVTELNKLEESPWANEQHGKGLSPQGLAVLLRPFRIRPGRSAGCAAPDAPRDDGAGGGDGRTSRGSVSNGTHDDGCRYRTDVARAVVDRATGDPDRPAGAA